MSMWIWISRLTGLPRAIEKCDQEPSRSPVGIPLSDGDWREYVPASERDKLLVAVEALEFIGFPVGDDSDSSAHDSWQGKCAREALAKIRGQQP